MPIKTPLIRWKIFLILDLFNTAGEGKINLGTDATQHRHPMYTNVQLKFDPSPSDGIVQHDVTVTYCQCPIAGTHVFKTQHIRIRSRFPLITRHGKWRWIAKLEPLRLMKTYENSSRGDERHSRRHGLTKADSDLEISLEITHFKVPAYKPCCSLRRWSH